MRIKVVKTSKKASKDYGLVQVEDGATVGQLKEAIEKHTRLSRYRQSVKFTAADNNVLSLADNAKTLASYGIKDGAEVQFRDLGPQIGYRTVFIMEYLGPLVFVLLYAMRPALVFGADAAAKPFDRTAMLGVVCWSIHFLKREFESVFVHRFSRPTMPLQSLFKNCAYYWSFGAVIGYPLCHPDYQAPTNQTQIYVGLAIFAISEFLNLCVHLQLRMMRPAEGSLERPIPKGPLFAFVSCPNYTFEVLGWIGFSLFTQILFSWLFTLVGFLQMTEWAVKKHVNYIKTYGSEYKKLRRKAIVPLVL